MSLTIAPPPPPAGPPPTAHPVVRFLDSLSSALDRLADAPLWSMTPEEQRHSLVAMRRQRARLEELELRMLAQADRDQVGAESGATSTPAWLAHETKTGPAARHADLHLATKLEDTFHATRAALAEGGIDVEKARIVIRAVETLTTEYDDLPPGTHERAEAHMVDLANGSSTPPPSNSSANDSSRSSAPKQPTPKKPSCSPRKKPKPAPWRTSPPATTATAPARAGSSSPPCTPTC